MIKVLEIEDFLQQSGAIPLLDARSESEYTQGHLPGSLNQPILNNEHRKIIGTLYKQGGKEAAVMKGFQLVGPLFYPIFKNIRNMAIDKKLALYCWRGGMRSNILAWMMHLADYEVYLLKGGYKAWRGLAHATFEKPYQFTVLSGKTGVGKTEVLRALKAAGQQVLDLEGLANHRGSAFGHLGLPPQPTVEHFENLIAEKLMQFDLEKPVWIENESRFVGKVRVPDLLYQQILQKPVISIEMDLLQRKERIWGEYGVMPVEGLIEATENLVKKLGGDRMKLACNSLLEGDPFAWLDILLHYYDKTYNHSMQLRQGDMHLYTPTEIDPARWVEDLIDLNKKIWKQPIAH